jgi:hypothetical protein
MKPRVQTVIPIVIAVALTVGTYVGLSAKPDGDWVHVARDPHYNISVDRARIQPQRVGWLHTAYPGVQVWFRTDHALPRVHTGKTFTRELVRALVQCDSLWFKVISVDMTDGDGKVVARQTSSEMELFDQPWRHVERGATEEIVAIAACHFGRQAGTRVVDMPTGTRVAGQSSSR